MDATSLFDCWDWPYEVDTYKYGREVREGKQEKQAEIRQGWVWMR
jgi:hypothetical protein